MAGADPGGYFADGVDDISHRGVISTSLEKKPPAVSRAVFVSDLLTLLGGHILRVGDRFKVAGSCPDVLGGCPDLLGDCPDVLGGCPDLLGACPDMLVGRLWLLEACLWPLATSLRL